MPDQDTGMQDIGGGVSVFVPATAEPATDEVAAAAARKAALAKFSEEFAKVTEAGGDPIAILPPDDALADPHLEFFLNNKPA